MYLLQIANYPSDPVSDDAARNLVAPANIICKICLTSWIIPHLSLSGASPLAQLLPFLISGPDLEA